MNVSLNEIRALGSLTDRTAPGRQPQFTEAHIVVALKAIGSQGPGRKQLAESLQLGEGVVRTLLRRLTEAGYVSSSRSGTALTKEGERLLSELGRVMPGRPVPNNDLTVAGCNYMVLVRGGAHMVRYGVEQRDAALLAGARGATTLLLHGGELHAPSLESRADPELTRLIMELEPVDGDAAVIGSADAALGAEVGAYSAAYTLLAARRV
jgi:predicted transcriptional regulator